MLNKMRIGVVTFPGSLDDLDAARAVKAAGATPVALFHAHDDLKEVDAVILPGGFSYGDYLRCGAIASFAPIMNSIVIAANHGFPVLGICNGFQVLCESHLLPGALTRNRDLHFLCKDQELIIENNQTRWTNGYEVGQKITIPLKNGEGSYQCDSQTLAKLEGEGLVVARYFGENPNGSLNNIASITNAKGNVVGLMPHPEHAIEDLTGPSADGLPFFTSILKTLVGK
jgi:phosphoribosylformylglycinamidine synthase